MDFAVAKRVRGILSLPDTLVRENYFFERRDGARSSRKVGSGLTEGISRYKAVLYSTRLRSATYSYSAGARRSATEVQREFGEHRFSHLASATHSGWDLRYEAASRWDCPNGPVKSLEILHGDHTRDSASRFTHASSPPVRFHAVIVAA